MHRAIDSLVNSSFLSANQSDGLNYLFKGMKDRPKIETADDLLEQLDDAEIGAAVVSIMDPSHAEWVGRAHSQHEKKILPAMIVNPLDGIDEIRRVVHYHGEFGVRCLRIPPFRYLLPPTDRVYWPFYIKAIELDIAVSMNVGMPGPRAPGWVQNPMYVDEVAYHFPELRLIMSHCGQPWVDEAISTTTHWENVYMCCSSVSPKYWPPQFVNFINTRGREKMMFATEYPTIPWGYAREEVEALSLRDNVQNLFFIENAKRAYKWEAEVN